MIATKSRLLALAVAATLAGGGGAALAQQQQMDPDQQQPSGRQMQQQQPQRGQQQNGRSQRQQQQAGRGEGMLKSEQIAKAPPGGDWKPVSQLTALPEFIPGLGSLYVEQKNMPVGPYLAYDRSKRLVSTIFMVPMNAMEQKREFDNLPVTDQKVDHVDFTFNAGHPGLEQPHYHIIMWHVTPEKAAMLK